MKSKVLLTLVVGAIISTFAYNVIHSNRERALYPEKHPHTYTPPRNIIFEALGRGRVRHNDRRIAKERSRLKQIGTTVAMYYSDGRSSSYPSNPQLFDIDTSILGAVYASPEKELPKDWQVPETWAEFNQSKAAYVFLRSPSEEYTGSSAIPMFIIRPEFNANPHCRQVVYEDGHVGCLKKDDAIKLWKKAGVWNGE